MTKHAIIPIQRQVTGDGAHTQMCSPIHASWYPSWSASCKSSMSRSHDSYKVLVGGCCGIINKPISWDFPPQSRSMAYSSHTMPRLSGSKS